MATKKKPAKNRAKPTKKPNAKKTKTPAKAAKKSAQKPLAELSAVGVRKRLATFPLDELVALIRETADFDLQYNIARAIALLGTPAAHRALVSLAMDPPKVAYAEDLVINAIHGLDEALDGSRSLHKLLLDTCESKADHPRVSQPMCALFNAADAPGALKDKRLHVLLRKALSDPNLVEVRSSAIYVLKKQNDVESLPLMVAALDRLGPNDGSSVVYIANFMHELRQVDATSLAKVRAARARLAEPLASYDDQTIERLAELVES